MLQQRLQWKVQLLRFGRYCYVVLHVYMLVSSSVTITLVLDLFAHAFTLLVGNFSSSRCEKKERS